MQIITDIEQGTPEWLALRLGIVTCSELDCLLVAGKGEAGFGVAAFTYMDQLIGERITEEAARSHSKPRPRFAATNWRASPGACTRTAKASRPDR